MKCSKWETSLFFTVLLLKHNECTAGRVDFQSYPFIREVRVPFEPKIGNFFTFKFSMKIWKKTPKEQDTLAKLQKFSLLAQSARQQQKNARFIWFFWYLGYKLWISSDLASSGAFNLASKRCPEQKPAGLANSSFTARAFLGDAEPVIKLEQCWSGGKPRHI